MNFRSEVESLLSIALEERSDLFLIDLKIGADNSIRITLDGDEGVTLKDCMFVSRAIEHNLDREEHDFSLEVGSIGVGTALSLPRQYIKNRGRKLEVEGIDHTHYEGAVNAADNDGFSITWKQRENKPVGKGKITVIKNKTFSYSEIIRAKVVL